MKIRSNNWMMNNKISMNNLIKMNKPNHKNNKINSIDLKHSRNPRIVAESKVACLYRDKNLESKFQVSFQIQ